MIANIYRGNGVRGLLNYISSKDNALLIATNLEGSTPREFAKQIGEVRKLYPRNHIAQPVAHIPFRPAPGEDLTDEEWQEVADIVLERLGYSNSPYAAYLHNHGDGRHLHIATYRVTFEGRLVSDSNDRYKAMEISRELEQRFGLTVAEARRPKRLTRPEIERRLRNPERESMLDALREGIDQAASTHDTVRGFITELNRLGLSPKLKVSSKTGALQGISFTLPDGSILKGSDLGKKYSIASICNRHELRIDLKPDARYLLISEVSDREFRDLNARGLAADLALRYGSRRTLYWHIPQGAEQGFADLIASTLPHRLISYAEALPAKVEPTPDVEARVRQVRLLQELVEVGADFAPRLPETFASGDQPKVSLLVACND